MVTPSPAAGTSDVPPPGQPAPPRKRNAAGQPRHQLRHLLGILGPGLITGAAFEPTSALNAA